MRLSPEQTPLMFGIQITGIYEWAQFDAPNKKMGSSRFKYVLFCIGLGFFQCTSLLGIGVL